MQIHLTTLGCRLNEAELETWSSQFGARGHQVVTEPADADIIILNSCAVTQEAVRKSRKSIQRLHRINPAAKMVVSGCYASLADDAEQEALIGEMGIDLIVNNADKDELVSLTEQEFGMSAMPQAATEPLATALFQRNRQRAFIKIQDGCRYRCTFCIVTVARGNEKSRSLRDIIEEVNGLHQAGVQEIALTGVHVGGYGSDIDTSLYSLVSAILEHTDMPRIRFASVEPWDLPDNFFALFSNPRLLPHMHLPLQSGSDTVLRRMARRCKTADFLRLTQTIRDAVPDFNITTDIIVGFPGETTDEWAQTLEFVEAINFGHIHIFSYSVRQGTKASRLPDQVHRSIKRARSQELHILAARGKQHCMEASVGQSVEILWEKGKQAGNQRHYVGYTPNYLRVSTATSLDIDLKNAITRSRLSSVSDQSDMLQATDHEVISQPSMQNRLLSEELPHNFLATSADGTIPAASAVSGDIISIKAVPSRTSHDVATPDKNH